MRLRHLHQDKEIKQLKYVKRFPNYSKYNIYTHAKPPDEATKTDRRKLKKGRPKVLSIRDDREIIKTFSMLRETLGSFRIKEWKLEFGLEAHVSDNTIIRILKRNNYYYLQSREV